MPKSIEYYLFKGFAPKTAASFSNLKACFAICICPLNAHFYIQNLLLSCVYEISVELIKIDSVYKNKAYFAMYSKSRWAH